MMLQRNLLYTGITRAKKLVVPAGFRKALAAAVRTTRTGHGPGLPTAQGDGRVVAASLPA